MANVSDHRPKPSPGPEARGEPFPSPVTAALLSAIADSGLSARALSRASGVPPKIIGLFIRGECGLFLSSAEKIATIVGVKVICEAQSAVVEVGEGQATQPIGDGLRAGIAAKGLTPYALGQEADVFGEPLRRFIHREAGLKLATVNKLFNVLPVKVVREAMSWRPEPKPPTINPMQPLLEALPSAIKAKGISLTTLAKRAGVWRPSIGRFLQGHRGLDSVTAIKLADAVGLDWKTILSARPVEVSTPAGVSSAPTPERRCPVELQGEGQPILVYGKQLHHMSGVAYVLLHAVVEAFRDGRRCTPSELANLTDSERPLRLFALALERPGFEPLRRVIPSYKGRKGRSIEIIDVGPDD